MKRRQNSVYWFVAKTFIILLSVFVNFLFIFQFENIVQLYFQNEIQEDRIFYYYL